MKNRYPLYVLLSAVFFALGGLFFKICDWSPLAISSGRSLIALCIIYFYLRTRKHVFCINRSVIIAALSIACTNTLYSLANKLTTAGNTIVLQFTMPVFVVLILFLVFHQKPSRLEILTSLTVCAGVLFFFIDSLSSGNRLGNLLALLSGFTYAGFFIFNSRENSEPFTAILLAYGLSFLIGLPSLLQTDFAATNTRSWLALLGLGVLQQACGQICFSIGIRHTAATTASLISGIEPILNPILVAIFYHEYIAPLSLIGAAIVLTSILYYNYRVAASQKPHPPADV